MNETELKEIYQAWLDGKEIEQYAAGHHVETIKFPRVPDYCYKLLVKPDNPPMPDYDMLIDLGVKHVLDAGNKKLCKVPEEGEKYIGGGICRVLTEGSTGRAEEVFFDGRRWIVEPDEYAPAKAAFRDGELQVLSVASSGWSDYASSTTPTFHLPPSFYRRKPKGGWVECVVDEGAERYWFHSPAGSVTNLSRAPSVKGFGQYGYNGEWCNELKRENGIIVKPSHVRFWRE